MFVAVSYRSDERDVGGRLRDSLARRLPRHGLSRTGEHDQADVLVVIVGSSWLEARDARGRRLLDHPRDPVRRALEAALQPGKHVVPLTLEDVAMPRADELPEPLAPFAEVDPVRASADYWEATVDHVVNRVRSARPRGGGLPELLRRRPKLSIAAAVGTLAGIVSILATLGVFSQTKPERGTVEVKERAEVGVTLPEYLEAHKPAERPDYPVEAGATGYVYDVIVTLDDAADHEYSLRWAMRDEGQGRTIEPFDDLVADRFGPAEANGVHRIWVPCPPREAVRYIVQFMLVNEANPGRQLNVGDSPPGDCRIAEE